MIGINQLRLLTARPRVAHLIVRIPQWKRHHDPMF